MTLTDICGFSLKKPWLQDLPSIFIKNPKYRVDCKTFKLPIGIQYRAEGQTVFWVYVCLKFKES